MKGQSSITQQGGGEEVQEVESPGFRSAEVGISFICAIL